MISAELLSLSAGGVTLLAIFLLLYALSLWSAHIEVDDDDRSP